MQYDTPLDVDGPDPFATCAPFGGHYVMVTLGNRLELMHVGHLADPRSWATARRRVLWTTAGKPALDDGVGADIWAPELHRFHGRWWIYFTGNTPDHHDFNRRVYALKGPSEHDDPMTGEWSFAGKVKLPSDLYTIDLTLLQAPNGKAYFIWSSKRPMDGWHYQHLVICEAIDPVTGGARETVISSPLADWERHDHPVNEGPQHLVRGNDLWLGFSASAYWTDHYAVGFLHARLDSDLLDIASWKKFDRPFFSQMPEKNVYGPGHASFVKPALTASDNDWWFLYHARTKAQAGHDVPRVPHLRPVRFDREGVPVLSDS
jgi:GH43 family beta-xylosidase